jgi:predicted TIM-barrel fold metal-dependent hydrolase
MATIAEEQQTTKRRRERTPVIDCDVHNALRKPSDLEEYLPARWHVYYRQGTHPSLGVAQGARPQPDPFRLDSRPAGGGQSGSDLPLLQEQLLERHNVVKAIVHPVLEVLRAPQSGEFGLAVSNAINDWMVAEWLDQDPRLYGAVSVPVEDGALAAQAVERAAEHPRFVKVMVTATTREGLGHSKYWPLYEIASAKGLPIAAHVAGFSGTLLATGLPVYNIEFRMGLSQAFSAQVISLVGSGVFTRFPNLRFVIEEGGIGWIAPLMWRLDSSWETMRDQVPHLTERPSAVIRRHFSLTTQPLDEPEQAESLVQLLDQIGMDDHIMFSSDYPHWDFDDPDRVLPASAIGHERRVDILHRNAERLFNFA